MAKSDWGFRFQRGVVGDWPKKDSGEPEEPVFLEHMLVSETEIALERNMLWAYGVPTVCAYPGDGALGKVVLGISGYGADLYVPQSLLEDAKNILSGDITGDFTDMETDINNEEE